MAFTKTHNPRVDELRPVVEAYAKNLADRIWGPHGPAWGTRLSELEDLVVELRTILSEKLLHHACQRQADADSPDEYQVCPECQRETKSLEPEPRFLQTRGGEVEWQEPQAKCNRCRRAFFPSVEKLGH
jgi:hypothetical protein